MLVDQQAKSVEFELIKSSIMFFSQKESELLTLVKENL